MSPYFTVDTTAFNAGIRKLNSMTTKSAVDIVNTKAYAVAAGAANETVIASKERIAREFGQIGTKLVRDKKTGRLKRGRRIYNLTKAEILVNWRRKTAGMPLLGGEELAKAARRFIGSRLGGVGFIVSGWIKAARDLIPYAKGVRFSMPGGIKIIGTKGKARPARSAIFSNTARIENDALIQSGGRSQAPGKTFSPENVAATGLQKAMTKEAANMLEYMAKKLGQTFRQAGAA